MNNSTEKRQITRRALLKQATAVGAIAVVGSGFVAAPNAT